MSLTGTWNLSIATPMGAQELELELDQAGVEQISGVSRGPEGEQALTDPVLTGNQLTWSAAITKPIKATLKMDILFDGDTVTGTAKAGMFPAAKVTGQRVS